MIGEREVLFERDEALGRIAGLLSRGQRGSGGAVVISGPPGIGKTQVLRAAVQRASDLGYRVFEARGADSELDFAFGCVLQMFEATVEVERWFSGRAELARPVLSGAFLRGAGGELQSAIHGLFWLCVNLSAQGPIVLAIDDLHAADEQTLSFLLYLLRRIYELPIVLIAATRPPDAVARQAVSEFALSADVRELNLEPLSDEAVAEVVRQSFDAGASPEFCGECARLSGGNPFYLTEMLRTLRSEGVRGDLEAIDQLRCVEPRAISRSVLLRLRRLPPADHALARACAVLGPDAPLAVAAQVADLSVEDALSGAGRLSAAEILRPEEPLNFAHPLIAAAIESDLAGAARAALSRRAADALIRTGAPVEAAAPHLLAAPPGGNPGVLDTLRVAAEHARLAGNPRRAAEYLERGLSEPDLPASLRNELLLELGRSEVSFAPERAEEHLREAITGGAEEHEAGRLALELGRAQYVAGNHGAAARTFLSAAERLGTDDPLARELRAWVASASLFVAGLRDTAQQIVGELVAAPPEHPTLGERTALTMAAAGQSMMGAPLREYRHLVDLAWGDGELLAQETCDGYSWMHLTAALHVGGDYRSGEAIVSAVLEDAQQRGSVMAFATASYIRGTPLRWQGRLPEALADFEQALRAHREDGWRMFIGASVAVQIDTLLERGCPEEAATLADVVSIDDYAQSGEGVALRYARGRLRLVAGDPEGALRELELCASMLNALVPGWLRFAPWFLPAARAHAALHDVATALQVLSDAETAARRQELPDLTAEILVERGGLLEGEAALSVLLEAVSLAAGSQSTLAHARALVHLGVRLRHLGRRTDARQPLLDGLELATACGATPLEDLARAELAVLGSRPRRTVQSGVHALTATERRVAELAVQGLTNRGVAEALFVTPKTVEYHLRNVYMKLGVSSRAGLSGIPELSRVG